jgi:hypothetical protein
MKRKRSTVRLCAVPGCGKRLGGRFASYAMRVCINHRHAPGYCQCEACAGEKPVITPRFEKRVLSVPYATGCSTMDGRANVSLRKEPWV